MPRVPVQGRLFREGPGTNAWLPAPASELPPFGPGVYSPHFSILFLDLILDSQPGIACSIGLPSPPYLRCVFVRIYRIKSLSSSSVWSPSQPGFCFELCPLKFTAACFVFLDQITQSFLTPNSGVTLSGIYVPACGPPVTLRIGGDHRCEIS